MAQPIYYLRDADESFDQEYRYLLTRHFYTPFFSGSRRVFWLLLNPSLVGKQINDPSVRKMGGFSCQWGFTEFTVGNLYPLRTPYPKRLAARHEVYRVGHTRGDDDVPVNDTKIERSIKELPHPEFVVVAWGNAPFDVSHRAKAVLAIFQKHNIPIKCLGLTKAGNPRHPVRLAYATPLEDYQYAA